MQTLNFSRCSRFPPPSSRPGWFPAGRPIPCGATRRQIAPVTGVDTQASGRKLAGIPWQRHNGLRSTAAPLDMFPWLHTSFHPLLRLWNTLSKRSVLRVVSHVTGSFPVDIRLDVCIPDMWIAAYNSTALDPCHSSSLLTCSSAAGFIWLSQIVKLTRMLFLVPPSPLSTVACELTVQSADLMHPLRMRPFFSWLKAREGKLLRGF